MLQYTNTYMQLYFIYQDVAGETPLHDAITEKNDATTKMLLTNPYINVWLQNNNNFNVMHKACIEQYSL